MRISDWSSDVCSSDLKLAAEQAEAYASPARLVKATAAAVAEVEIAEDGDEGETPVTSGAKASPVTRPSELLDAIFAHSRKGLAISRYKGLGEMNAEQLWETTLDPSHRSLLRVEAEQEIGRPSGRARVCPSV